MPGDAASDDPAPNDAASDDSAPGDSTPASSVRDDVEALHEHLVATAERPVEPAASRWLGEAEAVAADVAEDPEASTAVIRERAAQVRDLLSQVEGTGDDAADDRVASARALAEAVLERLPE